jgi:hypothetical protein
MIPITDNRPKPKRRSCCLAGCLIVILSLLLFTGLAAGAVLGYVQLPGQGPRQGIMLGSNNGLQLRIASHPHIAGMPTSWWGISRGSSMESNCMNGNCQTTDCDFSNYDAGQLTIQVGNCTTHP